MGGDSNITVTNDGATILRSIVIDNAAAKVLVDISKTQDSEVGDGTTSVVVLAGELLREAEKLMAQRVHPMIIVDGAWWGGGAPQRPMHACSSRCVAAGQQDGALPLRQRGRRWRRLRWTAR